jgi:dihydroprymidine dehydrogenase-like protein
MCRVASAFRRTDGAGAESPHESDAAHILPAEAGSHGRECFPGAVVAYPRAAWELILRDNPLPAVEGRVCYHPCEDACNRGVMDGAVSVHAVERFAGDLALAEHWSADHLGLMAIGSDNVYVAQVAMGASPQQTLGALQEAESHQVRTKWISRRASRAKTPTRKEVWPAQPQQGAFASASLFFDRRSTRSYSVGSTMSVRSVDVITPPMTTLASGR